MTAQALLDLVNREPARIAHLIDHTLLRPDATQVHVRQLCQEALQYQFCSVCVNPTHVQFAAELLQDSDVKVCTVVGFPLGATTTGEKIHEAEQAISDGAREIDMVINIGALKEGEHTFVQEQIAAVVEAAHQQDATCKVIIETALLTAEEIIQVCRFAKEANADFVKTSTGFSSAGAKVADVALMRQVVGPTMGVKASGGIRSLADARAMIEAGASRLGTSAGVAIVEEALARSRQPKLAIVLSTHAAKFEAVAFKGDFEANVKRIADLGYDGVELAIRDPKLVDPGELVDTVQRYRLAAPAIGTGQAWGEEGLSFTDPDPDIRQAAIERVLSHVPLAAYFNEVFENPGGTAIIIGLLRGVVRPGTDQDQAMGWLVHALQQCSAAAEPHGVRLALEPINRYETTLINNVAQGMDLIEHVGSPAFGLLLDTFHMNIEEPSIEASMRACGDRIFHFHVADSNRWPPGGGHLDFGHILGVLQEVGYQGYVSGEFLPKPDGDTAARLAIEHLRRVEV
jgi:deoxyribose-phosphate aldolase